MSHHQIFMSFRDGERIPFDLAELCAILGHHGCTVHDERDSSHFVSFPMNSPGGSIGSEGAIYLEDGNAIDFSVERPYYDDEFFALAIDLITRLNLCMVISSGEEAFVSSTQLAGHLPHGMVGTVTVATTVDQIKG